MFLADNCEGLCKDAYDFWLNFKAIPADNLQNLAKMVIIMKNGIISEILVYSVQVYISITSCFWET